MNNSIEYKNQPSRINTLLRSKAVRRGGAVVAAAGVALGVGATYAGATETLKVPEPKELSAGNTTSTTNGSITVEDGPEALPTTSTTEHIATPPPAIDAYVDDGSGENTTITTSTGNTTSTTSGSITVEDGPEALPTTSTTRHIATPPPAIDAYVDTGNATSSTTTTEGPTSVHINTGEHLLAHTGNNIPTQALIGSTLVAGGLMAGEILRRRGHSPHPITPVIESQSK